MPKIGDGQQQELPREPKTKMAMHQSTLVLTISGGNKKEANIEVAMIAVVGIRFEQTEEVDPGRMPNLGVITITVTTTVATETKTQTQTAYLIAGNIRRGRERRKKKKGDDQNGRTAIDANEKKENDPIRRHHRRSHRRLAQTLHQAPLFPRYRPPWIER
jgi:UDP-N-acetylglucosamine 2-epimerase